MATKAIHPAGVQMPDLSQWDNVKVEAQPVRQTEPHGRVAGIDYEQWAVAWEDARQKPERLAARAKSLEAKGFRELTGQTLLVHGVDSAVRVWVMPRDLYRKRQASRDQTLVDRVNARLYHEAALSAGATRVLR